MNPKDLEKYSSAITLSDMEIFVFPELMYSLVLANIMSPIIWAWREVDCFKRLEGKSSYRRLMRLKQYIIDEFEFNLDLETWGLTTKGAELARFERFISGDEIAKSNALFGYHGDKYYFDVDIRRHFGLDKYDSDVIPYWKTETVEAMQAFRLKKGYRTGAGECVSLAALYVAAAFVVCGIPLEDIFMILTPLHSQNFIDLQDGVLTNNRRVVTKAMWFNGTEITDKAQRALRNEQVTIVAHPSGYIHCMYEDATIDKRAYEHFRRRLGSYLSADLSLQMFANFLRSSSHYQKHFQVCRDCHGQPQFIKAETLFRYEHSSNYMVGDKTFAKLLDEVSDEDFAWSELPGRIRCDELEMLIRKKKVDLRRSEDRALLAAFLAKAVPEPDKLVAELVGFLRTEAKLPDPNEHFIESDPIEISVEWGRDQVVEHLEQKRATSTVADLAFYAYRDVASCDWTPFVKAAVERNPVSLSMSAQMSAEQVHAWLEGMADASIYDEQRLAQPDEVVNYVTGDGLEKAFVMANVIRHREPQQDVQIVAEADRVVVRGGREYSFVSGKRLERTVRLSTSGAIEVSEVSEV